jgi:predicted Zn-dependent protease
MHTTRSVLIFATIVALLAACATSPTGRRQLRLVSDAEMSQMGAAAFTQMKQKTPPTKDAKTNSYVQCITRALTAETGGGPWELQVFDSKDVNAFALPGGKMGVYTGLLKVAQTQDQLAAVIGHEIAHVVAGHSASRVSNEMAAQLGIGILSQSTGIGPEAIGMGANLLLLLPFSRGDESEADILGMNYMARAGFDPRQAAELWRNMARAGGGGPPQFMSTHPSHETRIRDLNNHLQQALPLYEQARAAGKRPQCS